jgi:hypothetical protein
MVTQVPRIHGRGVGGMSLRSAARLAWLLCALCLALTALSILLLSLNLSHPGTNFHVNYVDSTVSAISFAVVGALVASRRPTNPVGWLLCLGGVVLSIDFFCAQYAIYALQAQPGSFPAGEALAWIASWIVNVFVGLLAFAFLLFPTGRLPSRRWRPLAWLTVAILLADTTLHMFTSGPIDGLGPIRNPFGIDDFSNVLDMVLLIGIPVYLAVASSPFVRLFRAAGVERQQIKWFAYAAAATIGGIIFYIIPSLIDTPLWFERAVLALNVAAAPAIPVAIGIAILRYRLYEIDFIINRTLVYGVLTLTLGLVYIGGVTATQAIFRALTGQEQQPQLAIVISTLVIAALFNPLRRRIQGFIDRRFYRRKYDARKTLEGFSAKLRDETDLDALGEDLVGVVRETMQPAHVSLWLRPEAVSKGQQTE